MRIRGIDLCDHQGLAYWNKVARDPQVHFAYLQATQGDSYTSIYCRSNAQRATAAGVTTGRYHYLRPAYSATGNVDNFLREVGELAPGELPPALAIEWTDDASPAQVTKAALYWLEQVGQELGATPLVRLTPALYKWLGEPEELHRHSLWLQAWRAGRPGCLGRGWIPLFWQSTALGRVQGISGSCCLDQFMGTESDFQSLMQPNMPGDLSEVGEAMFATLPPEFGGLSA